MDNLTKIGKAELIKNVRALEADVRNAQRCAENSHGLQMEAEKSLQDEKQNSQRLSGKLSGIRNAIETVIRMKYSHINRPYHHEMPGSMKTDTDVEIPVNEELNLLRYLQDLTQAERSINDLCRQY